MDKILEIVGITMKSRHSTSRLRRMPNCEVFVTRDSSGVERRTVEGESMSGLYQAGKRNVREVDLKW